jgi:hypothetical protein
VFAALTRAIRSALESGTAQLPPLPGGGDPALGTALDALDAASAAIDNAQDLGAWAQAVSQWHQALENVAAAAFDRLAAQIPEALAELAARVLMDRAPRTAATFVLAGVIDNTGTADQPRWRLDYDALVDFISDPDTLINEQRWEELFADVGSPHSGRLPAVLAGLLLMAPRAVTAMLAQNLSIAGPAPPAVRGDPNGVWARFRGAAASWVSVTLPLGDSTAAAGPTPADDYGWTSGLEPDLSASLMLRSDRRNAPGGEVTDFEMWVVLGVDSDRWRYDLGSNWFVEIVPGISAGFGRDGTADQWHGAFAPLAQNSPFLPARPDDPVTIRFGRENPAAAPDFLFGPPYDTRFVIADIEGFLRFREVEPVFEIGAFIHGLALVIAPRWFRTFGQPTDLFREGWKFTLDFDVAYGVDRGLTLNLSSGLDVLITINKFIIGDDGETFNAKLHTIRVIGELLAQDGEFGGRIRIEFHVSCKIGPVKLVADGFGAWGGVWPYGTSGPGYYGRYWGLLPPTGVGLEIRFGDSVIGGGFVDFRGGPTERYAGLLMLKVIDMFEVTAFGIHERTPQGRTSFLAVIGIRFTPGIQLSYGFAITGFGGLVGINRRFDTDALRERLSSGAVGNVLFAPDPVRNAPIILGDADALFPPADGVHVAGPTARISWIGLVHLDVGILFEIATSPDAYGMTGITKIAVLGSAHATLDEEEKDLLHVQMDLAGFWDRPKKIIEFDSSLVRSRIFYVFLLTGDTAKRLSYGEQPYAMISLGGFHPEFNPEPAQFPEMARIGAAFDLDEQVRIWLRLELYVAITTNSIQTGQLIEAGIKAGPIQAFGFIGFDALIQFNPFKFSIVFTAGFRIRVGAVTVAGVHVKGSLSGPGPITISAEFCIEILFFDICWSGSFDLPPLVAIALPALPNLFDLLASALSDSDSMSASGGAASSSSSLVSDPQPDEAGAVIAPYGRVVWTQRVLPLDTELHRYEGQPLPNPQAFVVTAPQNVPTSEVRDHFAPGSYLNRTKSEQLSQATFERLPAGFSFGFDMRSGDPVAHNVTVQSYLIPEQQPIVSVTIAFPVAVVAAGGGRFARTSEFARTAPALSVANEAWVVHAPGGGGAVAVSSQTDAHTRAARTGGVATPANDLVAMGDV